MQPTPPLRARVGTVRSIQDLRKVGTLLAFQLGLPHPPNIKIARVPWTGSDTATIDRTAGSIGSFTLARWALRGKHKQSWEALEHDVVCAVGFWLASRRQDPAAAQAARAEALVAWYGEARDRPAPQAGERKTPGLLQRIFRWRSANTPDE